MQSGEEKKKPRPKDVFGRALPTEEQFEVLKNAPRFVCRNSAIGLLFFRETTFKRFYRLVCIISPLPSA